MYHIYIYVYTSINQIMSSPPCWQGGRVHLGVLGPFGLCRSPRRAAFRMPRGGGGGAPHQSSERAREGHAGLRGFEEFFILHGCGDECTVGRMH